MIATYFILKLTFQAILQECNRMAQEAENSERGRMLKARIVQLDIDYQNGRISDEEYGMRQSQILEELRQMITSIPSQGGAT